MAFPTSAPPVTRFKTPGGKTVLANSTNLIVATGVSGEGLITTVLPDFNAGMICQIAMSKGQFHGVIDATTPRGLRFLLRRHPESLA